MTEQLLESLMGAVRVAERFLGPDDDWVEDDRRIAFESAQRLLGGYHTFIYEKGPADYVTTVNVDSDTVEKALMAAGYQRNLASARKYRIHHDGGKQWACGSFVIDGLSGDGGYTKQHHVYLFNTPEGGTDVYAHRETSVTEGMKHLTDTNQESAAPGDLFNIFDRHELSYYSRDI